MQSPTLKGDGSKQLANGARLAWLDSARGMLLILGVILHSANIYTTEGTWVIADHESDIFFDFLVGIIHEFRMPTFFWISGYFCASTCARIGVEQMLKRRAARLAIPLIVSWITLNAAQTGFVAWWNGRDPLLTVLGGVPLFHLWFLVDLLIFILVAPVFLPWLRQLSDRLESATVQHIQIFTLVGLGVFGYLLNLAMRATGFAYYELLGITSLYRLSIDLPFFIGGAFMYYLASLRHVFIRIPFASLMIFLPLALFAHSNVQGNVLVLQELNDLTEKILVWGCIGGCLNLFSRVLNRTNRVTRFLADASYTIFLFSHCVVVVAGLLMMKTEIPIAIKFVDVFLISLIIPALIHIFLIRRNAGLRFCFNGH